MTSEYSILIVLAPFVWSGHFVRACGRGACSSHGWQEVDEVRQDGARNKTPKIGPLVRFLGLNT